MDASTIAYLAVNVTIVLFLWWLHRKVGGILKNMGELNERMERIEKALAIPPTGQL